MQDARRPCESTHTAQRRGIRSRHPSFPGAAAVIKSAELSNPQSCMSRAHDDEMTFVLLGRDVAAPWTIRFWAAERIRLGKNNPFDSQILEAYACAASMEASAKPPQKSQTISNLISAAPDMYEALEALWLEIGKY